METAAEVARIAVEGRVVPTDAAHPMVFSGTCLSCGRGEMAPGCVSTNQRSRYSKLRERGLSEKVIDLLKSGGGPEDLRQVEAASDADIAQMNAIAESR